MTYQRQLDSRPVGNTAGTVAAGDDPRIVSALQYGGTAGGDLSGQLQAPSVVATHLASPLPLAQGGTGNSSAGEATLAAGTVTVANTKVTANSLIFLSRRVSGGTPGHLAYARTAGASFTITSSSNTDTSTVSYLIVEPV